MSEFVQWYDITGVSIATLDRRTLWLREQPVEIRASLEMFSAEARDVEWRGPRATQFRHSLEHLMVGSLKPLEAAFLEAADMLAEQAAQQRDASAVKPDTGFSNDVRR